jgi:hypothetical protein
MQLFGRWHADPAGVIIVLFSGKDPCCGSAACILSGWSEAMKINNFTADELTFFTAILCATSAVVAGMGLVGWGHWLDQARPKIEVVPSEQCERAYIACVKEWHPESCSRSLVNTICPDGR